MTSVHLCSKRLLTAKLSNADAKALFEIYSDKEAMQYRGSKAMESLADALQMIAEQKTVVGQYAKLRLGIRLKANNQLIGTLLLQWDESNKEAYEIGFSFGKAHWGKGYGQETLKMVEEELPSMKKVKSIKAWCVKDNLASVSLFEKAGYVVVEQHEYPASYLFMKSTNHE